MNDLKEFISSGIIEMYCLNTVSAEERAQVEELSVRHPEIKDEIEKVNDALSMYAAANMMQAPARLKNKIITEIYQAENGKDIPPYLHSGSTIEEWINYLEQKSISKPSGFENLAVIDLPGAPNLVTYVAYAAKGVVVEETHDDEEEKLFVLIGSCTMTINGFISYHSAGDYIYIPKNSLHRAEVTSNEMMIAIGQRQMV